MRTGWGSTKNRSRSWRGRSTRFDMNLYQIFNGVLALLWSPPPPPGRNRSEPAGHYFLLPQVPAFEARRIAGKPHNQVFFVQEYNHPHFSFHFMSTFSASTGGWFRQSRKKLSKRVRSRHRHHFCTNQRFPLCKGCFIKLSFLPWNLLNILATSTAHTS